MPGPTSRKLSAWRMPTTWPGIFRVEIGHRVVARHAGHAGDQQRQRHFGCCIGATDHGDGQSITWCSEIAINNSFYRKPHSLATEFTRWRVTAHALKSSRHSECRPQRLIGKEALNVYYHEIVGDSADGTQSACYFSPTTSSVPPCPAYIVLQRLMEPPHGQDRAASRRSANSGSICGQSISTPTPFRKMPRTITRK